MKTNQLIENWKQADMKDVIGASVINKDMMVEIQGGAGYVNTLSGECNTSGKSCIKVIKEAVNKLFDLFL